MEYFGNKEILSNHKIGFLCSCKVSANIILKTYDWAIEQRDNGICVVSGFHSKIEKDVFDILIKGKQPIIFVLARGMKQRWESSIKNALRKEKLLIISPFPAKEKRITSNTSFIRNKIIIEISDKVYIPFASEGGRLNNLKDLYQSKLFE
jgi:predicted Rossmann fold nucleotide-binding protein DprA/Smf involved in DNA uptake